MTSAQRSRFGAVSECDATSERTVVKTWNERGRDSDLLRHEGVGEEKRATTRRTYLLPLLGRMLAMRQIDEDRASPCGPSIKRLKRRVDTGRFLAREVAFLPTSSDPRRRPSMIEFLPTATSNVGWYSNAR